MSALAIITARGGSKRIPRKNIRPFLGKPILLYSIEAALQAGIFDEVMVSTDDPEIAELAKGAGASVPLPPDPVLYSPVLQFPVRFHRPECMQSVISSSCSSNTAPNCN